MSKTKFQIGALLAIAMTFNAHASAQNELVPGDAAASKPTTARPAVIGEMTRLSSELRVETLKKELRDVKEEKKAPVAVDLSAMGGVPSAPLPSVSVRMAPQAPAVLAVYGTGSALRARLASGQDVQVGVRTGAWRVASIEVSGVQFERCEPARAHKTSRGAKKSECELQFVSPSND